MDKLDELREIRNKLYSSNYDYHGIDPRLSALYSCVEALVECLIKESEDRIASGIKDT